MTKGQHLPQDANPEYPEILWKDFSVCLDSKSSVLQVPSTVS